MTTDVPVDMAVTTLPRRGMTVIRVLSAIQQTSR